MYPQNHVVSFLKADGVFGGLSNLADNYPLKLNGITVASSEHLYQVLKFSDHPVIQEAILKAATPAGARKIASGMDLVAAKPAPVRIHGQKYAVPPQIKPVELAHKAAQNLALKQDRQAKIRADWPMIRLEVMEYCLRAKLINNWVGFGALLHGTGNREIVQMARRRESFWGLFTPKDGHCRCGYNHLGRLLMKLRHELASHDNEHLRILVPPPHLNLKLLGSEIETIDRRKHLCQVGTRTSAYVAEIRP